MTFKELLAQTIEWLQQDGRVSYRALQRQYDLDDDDLANLKEAISFSHPQACDEDGRGLVWTRELTAPTQNPQAETDSEILLLRLRPRRQLCQWSTQSDGNSR